MQSGSDSRGGVSMAVRRCMGEIFSTLPWMEATNSRKFEVTTLSNFPERAAVIGCQVVPTPRAPVLEPPRGGAVRICGGRVVHTPLKTVSHIVFGCFFSDSWDRVS